MEQLICIYCCCYVDFSFGFYELFISKIDAACNEENEIVIIFSYSFFDQLKDKIAKVIVMVLIVIFYSKNFYIQKYDTPLELLYFAFQLEHYL